MDHSTEDSSLLLHPAAAQLSALAEFVVVARLQHVTGAARALGMPQSTLSRRLARLEAALGTPLLVRRRRGVEVTRTGRALAAAAERALGELARSVQNLAGENDGERGVVTLAFLHTLGPEAVPRILRSFGSVWPGIRFRLSQEAHEGVLALLRSGQVDIGLTAPPPTEAGLASLPLQEQELCLVVPDGHRLAARRAVALGALAAERFIGFKPGYGMRTITDEWCLRAGFRPTLAFEGDEVATVRGLVAAGLGVALLPASEATLPHGVVQVRVHSPRATRTVAMAWRSDHPLAPPAAAFHDFMRERGAGLVAGNPEVTVWV